MVLYCSKSYFPYTFVKEGQKVGRTAGYNPEDLKHKLWLVRWTTGEAQGRKAEWEERGLIGSKSHCSVTCLSLGTQKHSSDLHTLCWTGVLSVDLVCLRFCLWVSLTIFLSVKTVCHRISLVEQRGVLGQAVVSFIIHDQLADNWFRRETAGSSGMLEEKQRKRAD